MKDKIENDKNKENIENKVIKQKDNNNIANIKE